MAGKEDDKATPLVQGTTTLSLRLPEDNSDRLRAGAAPYTVSQKDDSMPP